MTKWDVFISHASEDKEAVARPLASKLRRLGLSVWIDEAELRLGDSLSRKIDEGLANSTAGVVVLSKSFFEKNWPEYELRGLTAKTIAGDGRIIPVWHQVGQRDVARYSPTLADSLAAITDRSLDEVALQIVLAVRPDLHTAILRKIAYAEMVHRAPVGDFPPENIHQGPIRHAALPNALVDRIDLVRTVLAEVSPGDRNAWIEGFQRDAHPTKEIEVWEQIAARYRRVEEAIELSNSGKQAVFGMLVASSTGQNHHAAEILVKEFGTSAQAIFDVSKYDPTIFTPQTEDDLRRQQAINVEIQDLAGPAAKIDISYIEELVAERLGSCEPGDLTPDL